MQDYSIERIAGALADLAFGSNEDRSDRDRTLRRQSLNTKHHGKAQAAQRLLDRRQKEKLPPMEALLARHLTSARPRVSANHYYNIRGRLTAYLQFGEITDAAQITHEHVQRFVDHLTTQNLAPSTVRGYIVALSGWCQSLVAQDVLASNPCKYVKLPPVPKLPPRFLRPKEVEQALSVARDNSIYLQVLTALKTGMRSGELRRMDWEDIHWQQKIIMIPKTKSNRPRSIPLVESLAVELRAVRHKSGPVFPGERGGYTGEKQWRELLRPLQDAIPRFRLRHKGTGTAWHLLRHSFASRYVQMGGDIYKLSRILGHSSVVTTQRYAHLTPAHDDVMERI